MAKPCVVFLLYHGKSHFNASFRLARELGVTHDVLFAGVQFFERYVIEQGFRYYALKTVPFGFGLESWMCSVQKRKPVYWNTLKDRWRDYLYNIREAELNQLVIKHNPAIIFIDAQQATDFIALYPIFTSGKIKPVVIHFNLPSTLTEVASAKWKRMWLQKIKYFGMDDNFMIRRRIKRNKIPLHYFSRQQINYGFVIDIIPSLVLFPREIDLPQKNSSSIQHFLGFQIDYDRKENFTDAYISLKKAILEKVRNDHTKVIYCSLGTVPLTDEKKAISFLKKLFAAIEKLNAVLIVSTTLPPEMWTSSDRIHFFSDIPQLDVLSYTDLFITHGGSNSIKESIDNIVPMIVYPVEQSVDQPGNAARVVYHQLGLRGDIASDSESDILNKMNEILANPRYKTQLLKLKEQNAAYSIKKFLTTISH